MTAKEITDLIWKEFRRHEADHNDAEKAHKKNPSAWTRYKMEVAAAKKEAVDGILRIIINA